MKNPVKIAVIAVGATVAIAATGAAGVWVLDQRNEPEEQVAPLVVSAASEPATDPPSGSTREDRPTTVAVAGLDRLEGVLERRGDDADDWYVGGAELDFGPARWLASNPAPADLDGDGTIGRLADELRGLEGTSVTLTVRFDDDDRDDADVYVIDGVRLREPDAAPPWEADGSSVSPERAAEVAVAAAGPGARAVEVDRSDADEPGDWMVELIDGQGRELVAVVEGSQVVDLRTDD